MKSSLQVGAKSERTLLSLGAGAAVLGIAMSVGQDTLVASSLTLGGLIATIVGLHRFGRSGPDAPAVPERRSRRSQKSSKKPASR